MTDMDDLVAWLRAQLDDDERVARGAVGSLVCGCHVAADAATWAAQDDTVRTELHHVLGGDEPRSYVNGEVRTHIARWDPARVLAEVAAKRRILDLAVRLDDHDGECAPQFVEAFAQAYAERDGWREEWRT